MRDRGALQAWLPPNQGQPFLLRLLRTIHRCVVSARPSERLRPAVLKAFSKAGIFAHMFGENDWRTCRSAHAAAQLPTGCLTTDWQPGRTHALARSGMGMSWWCVQSACRGNMAAVTRMTSATATDLNVLHSWRQDVARMCKTRAALL